MGKPLIIPPIVLYIYHEFCDLALIEKIDRCVLESFGKA